MIRVGIYNENVHEKLDENVAMVYPEGIHGQLAAFLGAEEDMEIVRCYTLETINDITEEELTGIDVMLWWGHMAHHKVEDEAVQKVKNAVLMGMGLIVLHSGHHSKIFRSLMGTTCNLTWREDGDFERVWVVNPAHPITRGIGRFFYLPEVETYGEPFAIPEPDEVVFIGGYEGGEVFRSGCTFHRENGRIFYFQPGHETFPIYYDPNVQTVIKNAVRWANPVFRSQALDCPHVEKPGKD
ncbi:MAG: ThuA domain-containing protein [Lachnospiraceae bacterium]|nr:ThuA domain-containing protein [Lachnospiraceae bacterium]